VSQLRGDKASFTGAQTGNDPPAQGSGTAAEAGKFAASLVSGDQIEDREQSVSQASAAIHKHLSQILAQIQAGDYDSAIENIGFVIGDDFEELIEAGMAQDRRSGQGTAPDAITVEHVVLARRFIPRLRAIAQALKRAGGAKLAIAETERLIAEWNL
jgi:hypothetical protein